MAKRRRNAISGQFIARLTEMQESPAFRILSLSALRALARIEIELAHHAGTNNGRLAVTFKDFEKYGIRRHSIGPALAELETLGFMLITQHGTKAIRAEYRRPNLILLTTRPELEGVGPERCKWRRFKTSKDAEAALGQRQQREKSKSSRSKNLKTASAETAPHPVPKRHRKRENASAETAPLRLAETAPLSISRVGTGTRAATDAPPDPAQPTLRLAHDADRPTLHADDGPRLPFPTPAKG